MSSNQAVDFHDNIAAEFDQKYESSAAFRERFNVWTNLFRRYIVQTDTVIDLGCGSGIFSNYLAAKGCQVIGIDGSTAMIDLCNRKKTSVNVRYVKQSLPLIDSTSYSHQDIVLMSSLLEYIADTDQIIQQVNSLLRPGGLFIVSIPNESSIYRWTERILFRLIKLPRYVAHLRSRSTERRFREQLTARGFDVLERVYFSNHDPISRSLKPFLPEQFVNNLFVVVCRKRERND